MKCRALLLSLSLGLGSPAHAADWWIVLQRDGAGNVHFGDTAQLRRSGDIVSFWSHLFWKQPTDEMKSARIQYEVNCGTSSMRERRYLDYNAQGDVIKSGDNTGADAWAEVAPETSGSAYVAFACANPEERRARFLSVASTVDIFKLADFYLDPSPIVEIPQEPPPTERQD